MVYSKIVSYLKSLYRYKNFLINKNSKFNYNGLAGLHNGGDNTLIEYCEFGYNGWAGFSGDWARGGCKVPHLTNSILRRNYAHHNIGQGFGLTSMPMETFLKKI